MAFRLMFGWNDWSRNGLLLERIDVFARVARINDWPSVLESYSHMPVLPGEIHQRWWWPWGRRRVRMVFPCPACFHPLMALVEPDLDLECPICRTTFRVPAPPAAAPPPTKKVFKPDQGYGIWAQVLFALGLVTVVIAIVAACFGITHLAIGCMVVGVLGGVYARFRNFLRRRSNADVPKLNRFAVVHESIQAVGAIVLGICALPCIGCLVVPFGVRPFWWVSLF